MATENFFPASRGRRNGETAERRRGGRLRGERRLVEPGGEAPTSQRRRAGFHVAPLRRRFAQREYRVVRRSSKCASRSPFDP